MNLASSKLRRSEKVFSSAAGELKLDAECRVTGFDGGAEAILGYEAEDVVGKKRLPAFLPGLVAIAQMPRWIASAAKEGAHGVVTQIVRKDGVAVAAELAIERVSNGQTHSGYRARIKPRTDIDPLGLLPSLDASLRMRRFLLLTRAPFLTVTLTPVAMAGAWVAWAGLTPFPWLLFFLTLVGACALHVAANVFNDVFDWRSGADPENTEYFNPFTGGSRAIEMGLATERGLLLLASGAVILAALIGLFLVLIQGPGLILFGVAGVFSGYFYTAPPLRLVARRGLGELLIVLNFGPLMTAGTVFALTGSVDIGAFLIGLPLGLLTAAILWINEFPDAASDERTGKRHLVVVLGKRAARWGYIALVSSAFLMILVGVAASVLPALSLIALLGLPLAIRAVIMVMRHFADRALVAASASSIGLQAVVGLLLTFALVVAIYLPIGS